MQPQEEHGPLKSSLPVLARGLGRLFCSWCLAELMVHLMYMHAIYSSAPLLGAVSCWTLGNCGGSALRRASFESYLPSEAGLGAGGDAVPLSKPSFFFFFFFKPCSSCGQAIACVRWLTLCGLGTKPG